MLTPPFSSLPAEDVSGESGGIVSTISSSRSPLQPPDADDGEPFTTYFDSKIPIPEDETVSGKNPAGKICLRHPPESSPRAPVPLPAWTGDGYLGEKWWGGLRGWEGGLGDGRGGRVSRGLGDVRPVLIIDPVGFGSCLQQSKSRERSCRTSGRDLGSLFPYQGAGALPGLVTLSPSSLPGPPALG